MTETPEPQAEPPAERPVLVWVISILYGVSAAWSLFAFSLIYSGSMPMAEAQRAYFDELTLLDHSFTVLISGANLVGAILLFCLKRQAFYFLLAAFASGLLLTVYHIAAKDWLAAIGVPGLFGAAIGWSINIAIILYTKNLITKNVLR